jgi:YD repeat-containing protein
VTELSGRTVNYGYDNLYRLTSETIVNDPNSVNGAVSYVYDAVGNRKQKVSTIPGYPGGLSNYNPNDPLATDTYDANGNTTASTGLGYAYDFENHLVQQGGLTIVYDGDGNRVAKTTATGTTKFLVDELDELNPSGYAQVVDELQQCGVSNLYLGLGTDQRAPDGQRDAHDQLLRVRRPRQRACADGCHGRGHRHLRLRRVRQPHPPNRHDPTTITSSPANSSTPTSTSTATAQDTSTPVRLDSSLVISSKGGRIYRFRSMLTCMEMPTQ